MRILLLRAKILEILEILGAVELAEAQFQIFLAQRKSGLPICQWAEFLLKVGLMDQSAFQAQVLVVLNLGG